MAKRAQGGGIPASARGVALILVLTVIAVLTALGVDFSYGSRVSLKLAENARDGLRAEYQARSAVNLARLLLHFQKQLDTAGGQAGAALQRALQQGRPGTPPGAPPLPGAGAAATPTSLGIRLWQLVPIDSNSAGMLLGADEPRAAQGSYRASIVDENSRINVVGLNGLGTQALAALIQMRAMMADPKYDFIFNEEDAQRDRVSRDDVILSLKDWIDEDDTGSGIDPTQTRGNPFVHAFSDESGPYARYTPRYRPKNARPDSLEELYQVRGVNDRFMAAFGDRLTVWPDINSKLNVNTDDPLQQATNVLIAADNPNDARLRDPALLRTILQAVQLRKMFGFFGLTAQDFLGVLVAHGIKVRPELLATNSPNNFLGEQSDTFRITATGRAGHIERTVTAVVRYDDLLGRLLYWKEE